MVSIIFVLAFVTFLSTMVGGTVAIRLRERLPLFFAFAAGSLIGVSFFDLLPESLNIAASVSLTTRYIMATVVASFLFYSFLERYFLTHRYEKGENLDHGHIMGPIGAGSLSVHSFLDGVAIGTAYQVSAAVGIIVALAVIFHDFTDGINTVTVMLRAKQRVNRAKIFLFVDAAAPVLGVLVTSLLSISPTVLALILAAFTGEFLYIGASSLLPETYKHNSLLILLPMVLGVLLIFLLTSIIAG